MLKIVKKINVIYTFTEEQDIIDVPFHVNIIKDSKTFEEYLTSMLTEEQMEHLRKISTCIYNDNPDEIPNWYFDCYGKFYYE